MSSLLRLFQTPLLTFVLLQQVTETQMVIQFKLAKIIGHIASDVINFDMRGKRKEVINRTLG